MGSAKDLRMIENHSYKLKKLITMSSRFERTTLAAMISAMQLRIVMDEIFQDHKEATISQTYFLGSLSDMIMKKSSLASTIAIRLMDQGMPSLIAARMALETIHKLPKELLDLPLEQIVKMDVLAVKKDDIDSFKHQSHDHDCDSCEGSGDCPIEEIMREMRATNDETLADKPSSKDGADLDIDKEKLKSDVIITPEGKFDFLKTPLKGN